MAVIRRSVFIALRATLLTGALIVPLVFLTAHLSNTTASPEKNVCVAATWRDSSNIVSLYGACPELVSNKPTSGASEAPSPSVTTATPSPTVEASSSPTPTAPAQSTDEPSPSASATGSPEATSSPAATPTPTFEAIPTNSPSPEPTFSASPTSAPSPSPTHTPDVTVSPTPVASSPVVPPEPDPIPIPPANTDPKTKSFLFCHNGGMLSNSYTGMMNGHHGNHPEDIIPPIPFKFYGGWNWTAENAKTFYNNCVPVK